MTIPRKLATGTEHFAAHCAVCHGAPGVPKGDIAEGKTAALARNTGESTGQVRVVFGIRSWF